MNQMTPFCKEVLEVYIREEMGELDNPMRKDHRMIFQELRYLFRSYGHLYRKPVVDWTAR